MGKEKMKLSSKLRLCLPVVAMIIVYVIDVYVGYHWEHKPVLGRTLKFMTHKEELTVKQFSVDPINNRDFAWDAEDIPEFMVSYCKKAFMRDYDGVEYSFGENKIYVEKDFFSDDLEITLNTDLGWSMSNFSIYSSGENIVIYGYWNDEFRRITLGKTQESIVLPGNQIDHIPISLNITLSCFPLGLYQVLNPFVFRISSKKPLLRLSVQLMMFQQIVKNLLACSDFIHFISHNPHSPSHEKSC